MFGGFEHDGLGEQMSRRNSFGEIFPASSV